MNDVSILYPLPATLPEQDKLLTTTDTGAKGALLPEQLVSQVQALFGGALFGNPVLKGARVIAIRLDPCFASVVGGACQPQMRLVLQPLFLDDGKVTNKPPQVAAFDSALHAFYKLSPEEFTKAVETVVALRTASGGTTTGPLVISPVLAREGIDGPYARGLKSLVLSLCGEQSLVRLTFTLGATLDWRFGGSSGGAIHTSGWE